MFNIFDNIVLFFDNLSDSILLSVLCYTITGFVVLLIVCFSVAIVQTHNKYKKLSSDFDDNIRSNSYYRKEFGRFITDLVYRKYDFDDDDAIYYGDKMYDVYDDIIFEHHTAGKGRDLVFFNLTFCKWIYLYWPDARVCDFRKAMIKYRRFLESQINQHLLREKEEEYKSELAKNIANTITISKREKYIASYIDKKEQTTTHAVITAYNECIKKIKQSNMMGLLPSNPDILQKHVLDYIKSVKIIDHQRMIKYLSSDMSKYDKDACCVIYNTFTHKYYVVNSEHIFTHIKTIIEGSELNTILTLGTDISLGHLCLFRILYPNKCHVVNSDVFKNMLVTAYDSVSPKGYN